MRDVQMISLEKEIKGAARDTAATRANKMCATCVFLFWEGSNDSNHWEFRENSI